MVSQLNSVKPASVWIIGVLTPLAKVSVLVPAITRPPPPAVVSAALIRPTVYGESTVTV